MLCHFFSGDDGANDDYSYEYEDENYDDDDDDGIRGKQFFLELPGKNR